MCRLIIATFDSKGFGKINFKEFKDLICSIKFWQSAFKTHTKEKTGILKAERLREALLDVGFQLNSSVMGSIVSKYIRKDGTLRFGDFVGAILNLSIAFSESKEQNLMTQTNPNPISSFRLLSKKRSKPIRHRAANADGVLEVGLDVLVASSAYPGPPDILHRQKQVPEESRGKES